MQPEQIVATLSSDYALFERVLHELLTRHLREQGKEYQERVRFRASRERTIEVDGFAPQGIDDLEGPTIIEFKTRLVGSDRLVGLIRHLSDAAQHLAARSILVVVGTPLDERSKKRVGGQLGTAANVTVRILDAPGLAHLLSQHAEFLSELVPSLLPLGIRQATEPRSASFKKWRPQRDLLIGDLRQRYHSNGIVLFLGAGVSVKAGIPGWTKLIQRLIVSLVESRIPGNDRSPESSEMIAALLAEYRKENSPLAIARFVRTGLEDRFPEAVHRALYQDVSDGQSQLLRTIARLCNTRHLDGVRSVVTYNFDDLLEKQLADFGILCRSIYRDNDVAEANELGIYHVHGFLPREYRKEEIADSLLVFSEEGYHTVFMDPYSWSNVVQLSLLRERTCLFVGLSLTDPNLRRLAEFAAKKATSPKHFILLRRERLPESMVAASLTQEVRDSISATHHGLEEVALRELGLNVIWFEDFEEIDRILEKIRHP